MNNIATTNVPSSSPKQLSYLPIILILILAAGLRIALALLQPSEPTWPDGHRYNRIAEQILADRQYPVSESHTAPLNAVVLASVYGIFGFNGTAARIAMAIFGTLTCGVLYGLGKRLFGKEVGIIASLVLAVYPFHVYLSSLYECAQPVFILLLCLAVHQLVSSSQMARAWHKCVFSGVLFGLAAMTVPTILSAAPLLAIWLFFVSRHTWRRRVLRVIIFTISCSSIVLSWSAYVYAGTGNFQLGSGIGAEALFNGNCSLAWEMGKADIVDIYEEEGVPDKYRKAYEEYQSVMQQARSFPKGVARNQVYLEAVKGFFIERPKEAGLLLARKALLYWCPYAMTVTKSSHNNNLTKAIQIISFVPILVLALISVYLNRNRIALLMPIYIIVLSQWVTYSMFFPTTRYRSHVDVFLILLAAPTMIVMGTKIKEAMILGRKCENTA
jgi:4-amino-4-deoxy-L-arabinose transferase-like glycosyltransferase